MPKRFQCIRELLKVIERREGRIVGTQSLGYFWVELDQDTPQTARARGGDFWEYPRLRMLFCTMRVGSGIQREENFFGLSGRAGAGD